jgi:3D-(3,5/4)-trihydroxycyclohexane-1,2-dione acylhydrolase (decyclizing)
MKTERLTTAQALVRFLSRQYVERDGRETRFFDAVAGIFGHGNLAGVGQALLQAPDELSYMQVRNEQGMVHMAAGYARMANRLATLACTTSTGPGATNMVTGAALATINHLPVLLLPADIFSTRTVAPVLQQLEAEWTEDVSVNDAFRSVSRYWDRINRPEQLPSALMSAMRVLTSPADTGAVTLALPQDVQAEAYAFPAELFERRVWPIARPRPDVRALARAVEAIRGATAPLIIAGGGVIYSEASAELASFVEASGIPVGETQAGKGSLPFDHQCNLGSIGVSGSAHANRLANRADVIIGIGTRYTDYTTASKTLFQFPDPTFVNVNVAEFDSAKHGGIALTGDAREVLVELARALDGWTVPEAHRADARAAVAAWQQEVATTVRDLDTGGAPTQAEIIGLVNDAAGPRDVVVAAAGSLPGDLHRFWRTRDPKGYHCEYGYSCMGYEIAGALGAKLADPGREVFAMVGDGSWLMMSQELLTSVQEASKLIVVLVDNDGFGSIGSLSESLGSQGFGTRFRFRGQDGLLSGGPLPLDLPANARSLGATVLEASTTQELRTALAAARDASGTTVVYIHADPKPRFGGSGAWWDVPVAEVASLDSTNSARVEYEAGRRDQRHYL